MSDRTRPRVDLGYTLAQVLRARASWSLLGMWVLVVVLVHQVLDAKTRDSLLLQLGLSREGLLAGMMWQPLSYALLHGGWQHLLLNGCLLLLVGSRVEHVVGIGGLVRVFVAGVVGGAFAHLAIGDGILVGASAGVVALLLCATTLSPDSQVLMPARMSARNLGRGLVIASLLLLLLDPSLGIPLLGGVGKQLTSVHGFATLFKVSHAAHCGGMVAGWLCARWWLRPRVTLKDLQQQRARREGH